MFGGILSAGETNHVRTAQAEPVRVARRGTPREINRQIVLNLVRAWQPVSRADLARLTGTRRGAISLIVNDLIAQGMLYDGAKGETPRGRKPQFLYIDSRNRCVVAVDVRPTRTFYMVTEDGKLVYVGFAPRLHDPDGGPFAGVNLVVLERNREVLSLWNRFPTDAARVDDTEGRGVARHGRAAGHGRRQCDRAASKAVGVWQDTEGSPGGCPSALRSLPDRSRLSDGKSRVLCLYD